MPVQRVRELLDWVREGEYDRIVGGDYMRRGEEPPLRDEVDAAAGPLRRARQATRSSRPARRSPTSASSSSDWLKRQRPDGEDGAG